MPIDAALRGQAIEMLKNGHVPGAVHTYLVRAGAPFEESQAMLHELLHLKAQAEAREPARLREQATWMLFQRAPVSDVLAYFTGLGIAEPHARPEIDRIAAIVPQMVPCQTCGRPMLPQHAFFDAQGNQVCKTCNVKNELGAAQERAIQSEENERNNALAIGVLGVFSGAPRLAVRGFVAASRSGPAPGPTTCPRCKLSSGVHVQMLAPHLAAALAPGWTYACGRCGTGIA